MRNLGYYSGKFGEIDGKPVDGKAPVLLKSLQDEVMREFYAETE